MSGLEGLYYAVVLLGLLLAVASVICILISLSGWFVSVVFLIRKQGYRQASWIKKLFLWGLAGLAFAGIVPLAVGEIFALIAKFL
jgi:hypothetical protein